MRAGSSLEGEIKQVVVDGREGNWEWRIKWGEGYVWHTGAVKN